MEWKNIYWYHDKDNNGGDVLKWNRATVVVAILLLAGAVFVGGCTQKTPSATPQPTQENPGEISVKTKHGTMTLEQLAEIQPGLGTVMIEYGKRFYRMYVAAEEGNWDLAKYELEEAKEIQEVGETTRPNNAEKLKNFESTYLDPIEKAIDAKDLSAFENAYNNAIKGCNGCHAATGHPYIKYPDAMPEVFAITKHGTLTLRDMAEIQPGLGTVMMEYGKRFYIAYYAAKEGNWDLAKYELEEAKEIQEVGETTRPGKAQMLKAFEQSYLDPLEKAIDAKDWNAFEKAYSNAVQGCNNCHAATGHPYIKYVLPQTPPDMPEIKP